MGGKINNIFNFSIPEERDKICTRIELMLLDEKREGQGKVSGIFKSQVHKQAGE